MTVAMKRMNIVISAAALNVALDRIAKLSALLNNTNLFDGCNFRESLLMFSLVAFSDFNDLLPDSDAHAFVGPLPRTRQQHQAHKQHSTTHQVNRRHAAVALQTLRNQTTPHISQRVACLHHTTLHVPLTRLIRNTTSRIQPRPHYPPPPLELSHMPLLTKSIFFRRLNRPRLAHSGTMSSSFSCGSVWCELHVSGGRRGRGRQRRRMHRTSRHIITPANVLLN